MKEKAFGIGPMIYSRFQVLKWRLGSYLKGEEGATAVEYALVIAIVVAVVVSAATFMKQPLINFFQAAVDKITQWMGQQKP
jgi:Flp pilus assembly pilin Flp